MARRGNDVPTEPLVPIDAVAANIGILPETVWGRLNESDVRRDWNGGYCVSWSTAKSLFDTLTAERDAHETAEAKRRAEQMEREAFERSLPTRAYEAARVAAENRVRGIEVSVPGEPEPEWARGEGSDE